MHYSFTPKVDLINSCAVIENRSQLSLFSKTKVLLIVELFYDKAVIEASGTITIIENDLIVL